MPTPIAYLGLALDQVIAYHGTRTSALQSIRDNGILAHPFMHYHPSRFYTGERGSSVYVTEDPLIAAQWAMSEVQDPHDATILQVELPPDRLRPDEEAPKAERFLGDIPPEWIKAAYPLTPEGALGPGLAFRSDKTNDAGGKRRFIAIKHRQPAQDAQLAMDRAIIERDRTHGDILAMDRDTARRFSDDGHLHVSTSNISKATVNPYRGEEIPNYEQLGLDPNKRYMLLRHPDELKKAASTFNNLPILAQHVPISAARHRPDLTIGSTGTDAVYKHPYLKNSLVFWTQPAIDAIEDEDQKELSCAYHYDADMTPGEYEGKHYDGIMRNIRGNHVALVKEGRAGSDVVVGDSKEGMMKTATKKLSPAAMVAKGALLTYLTPKLAQDASIDYDGLVADITSKNYGEHGPKLVEAVKTATKDKLAKDADIEDFANLIDALKPDAESADNMVLEPNAAPPPKNGKDAEPADTVAKIKELLEEEGVSPEILSKLDAFLAEGNDPGNGGEDEEEDDDPDKRKAKDGIIPSEQSGENAVTKEAMDAAIKVAVKTAQDAAITNQQEIRAAERFVRPWVGEIAMDAKAPEDVYRSALKALGVKGHDTLHPDALRPVLEAQPQPKRALRSGGPIASDSKPEGTFAERFPAAVSGVRLQ